MPAFILIGPPGAGKSSDGKALGKLLKVTYTDTDALIEARTGKKISEIFVEDGEESFRTLEAQILAECLQIKDGVLSLGGGAILNPNSQALVASSESSIIFLDVSISQAAPRVGFNKDRPLLLINPRQQWLALMEKRRPIYEALASHRIVTDHKKAAEVALEIADLVGVAHD